MRYTISIVAATLALAGAAGAEVPQVVADIPPVHALVARVMDGVGDPVLLVAQGMDAHDLQLRPSQAAALSEADLVVWIGPEMTPWLDHALQGSEARGARLELLEVPGTLVRVIAEDHGHDHDEEGAPAQPDEAEAGHHHEGIDPHAWLDPGNAVAWLVAIAAELSRIDPDHAATYAANAARASREVAEMDARLAEVLAPVGNRPLVFYHDAYGYFAGHYGLTVMDSIAAGNAAPPGAAHLREIGGRASEAACVFPEANHDTRLAERLAADAGLRLGPPLDPEGSSLPPGPGLYEALMEQLAQGILDCLPPG